MMDRSLLEIAKLSVSFAHRHESKQVLQEVDLRIAEGEIVGLLGPSGSGKSALAGSIFNRWSRHKNALVEGSINYMKEGVAYRLLPAQKGIQSTVYGQEISMVFQEPALAFNPVLRIKEQVLELLKKHKGYKQVQARQHIDEWLPRMGFHDRKVMQAYPHELSGGQLQRMMLLMAVVTQPRLLIADEPTTSLDSVAQMQVLQILKSLNEAHGISLLIISHNPRVMRYLGATTYALQNKKPVLLSELPSALPHNDLANKNLAVETEHLPHIMLSNYSFAYKSEKVLDGITLEIRQKEVLGIVGPSGCGKSTLAKIFCGLETGAGTMESELHKKGEIQLIFQHPGNALDPMQTCLSTMTEALKVAGVKGRQQRLDRAQELLAQVGLHKDSYHLLPAALSGGQKQRLCIGRALCSEPKLLICDEAVSSLDEELKYQMVKLILDIQQARGMAVVFISHDLALVASVSDRIVVMDAGKIVAEGNAEAVLQRGDHPVLIALRNSAI